VKGWFSSDRGMQTVVEIFSINVVFDVKYLLIIGRDQLTQTIILVKSSKLCSYILMFQLLPNSNERQKMCSIFFFLSIFYSSQHCLQRSCSDERIKRSQRKTLWLLIISRRTVLFSSSFCEYTVFFSVW